MLFFKFVNGLVPEHLAVKFPQLVSDVNPYHRRRPLERQTLPWTTALYHKSYFPSTTLLWNELPDNFKSLTSISAFKRNLRRDDPIVPSYFYSGDRTSQIIHCKLRLNMSDLKSDLFTRHISEDKTCTCGFQNENANHYLLNCPAYNNIRRTTLFNLPPLTRNCHTLLFGNVDFSLAFNRYIVLTVQEYINLSRRFE